MSHILNDDSSRFVIFPIKHSDLWNRYEKQLAVFWNTNEVDLESDLDGWNNLNESEKQFLLQILGFFAASDGLVVENIMLNFQAECMASEARSFFTIQNAIETIHGQQYALLIQKFAPTEKQRNQLFQAIENHASTKAKADWALSKMKRNDTEDKLTDFSKRLISFACVEGIMFSSSFCAIFFFKNRGDCQMPGLFLSNEFISRDEGLHRDFAVDLYKHFPKLPQEEVEAIVKSAVGLEQDFVREILPDKQIRGMNAELMCQYVEFVADNLMRALGYANIYNSKLPQLFNFMQMISLEGKTNFFERRVSEYSLAGVGEENNSFNLNSSF
jgi:ribonucleoside-diphosphate reductase beta chain